MTTWLFQGNPDRYNIDAYLRETSNIYWSVRYPKHHSEMVIGDDVYIWRAKGHNNAVSGIIAYGVVDEECTLESQVKKPINLFNSYWIFPHKSNNEYKAGVALKDIRLSEEDGMLTSAFIYEDLSLRSMGVFTSRVGVCFKLSDDHASKLRDLWSVFRNDISIAGVDYLGEEGKINQYLHRVRERDPILRKLAIDNYLKIHKCLRCEVCGFSFEEHYGELGKNFIEVHHLKPLSEYSGNEQTLIDNLKLVCSNCHALIHRGDPFSTYFLLKELFNNQDNEVKQ